MISKPRVAVVSPFIDKSHGTERLVAEWISALTSTYDVHIYSNRVEDMDLSQVTWHRVPELPGPYIFKFLWWLVANHLWRWRDRRFRGLRYDLVYTPGTNCFDADVISVHIVFAELLRQIRSELKLTANPASFWPRLIHRRLYYGLVIAQERRLYADRSRPLIIIARKTAEDLKRFYGRSDNLTIVYVGLDHDRFSAQSRMKRREAIRKQIGVDDSTFVLLLIGNDWKKKGLPAVITAMGLLKDLRLSLLVVGKDDRGPFRRLAAECGVEEKVRFLPLRRDVETYHAAADAYVGPSLEDTYALPPVEAMACGLPMITTIQNGTAEIVTDGVDGFVLQDPLDATKLAERISALYRDPSLCQRLGEAAARTASRFTWQDNARQIDEVFRRALSAKQAGKVAASASRTDPV